MNVTVFEKKAIVGPFMFHKHILFSLGLIWLPFYVNRIQTVSSSEEKIAYRVDCCQTLGRMLVISMSDNKGFDSVTHSN